ncbi:hypothetical protein [Bosea sp. 124]|uniref:hypothetical protein n=1 Tax=Bosea sp. 124 TaxID=2135642 RepID=UPI0011B237B8|nr:hypothetical protein [Bosea sp. 124]
MTKKTIPACIGRSIKPAHSAAAVDRYVPTDWPRVGGNAIAKLPRDAFTKPAFEEAYEPGRRVNVYVAACGQSYSMPGVQTGLLGAARDLLAPVYKVAATECADPRDRMDALNADRYAAHRRTISGDVTDLGFDRWTLQQIRPMRQPKPGAPIELQPRVISVVLPHGLSARAFEKRLHDSLANASLNAWLVSPEGMAHCALLGRAPCDLQRFTVYRFGTGVRVSPADELYLFRPRGEDAERLLSIVEQIIFQHVTGVAPAASASWSSPSQRTLTHQPKATNPQPGAA